MLIDLHVHTSRYSSCGKSSPEEMAQAAVQHGLDAIVITEHNVSWPADELAELRQAFPQLLILNGIELTSDCGDDYLVLGLPPQPWYAPRLPASEIACRSHALGGLVILAHPYRYSDRLPDTLVDWPVDGVEIASCNMHGTASAGAIALAHESSAFPVWNSDAHHVRNIGLYANVFPRDVTNEHELATALRRREHHGYADESRIRATNEEWRRYLPLIHQLIAEGASDEAIRAATSTNVGFSDLYAVRAGLDVMRPLLAPPLAEAIRTD